MVWKITLAAAAAAMVGPLTQLASPADTVLVSGGAWTGLTRSIAMPASGADDPAFMAALRAAAQEVCTPSNTALRSAAREEACQTEAIAAATASLPQYASSQTH